MRTRHISSLSVSLPIILFSTFMILLWLAGGASRADALGQVIVRFGAWAIILAGLLIGMRLSNAPRPIAFLMAGILLLPMMQLIPLPTSLWIELSGQPSYPLAEQAGNWRPFTLVPGATLNSLSSLIVPVTIIFIIADANDSDHRSFTTILLLFVLLSVLLGLVQLSGVEINNPLINYVPGYVSSIFANRNHFALLVGIGCMLAPVWALTDEKSARWLGPLSFMLIVLFISTILAVGSRSGLLLAAVGLTISTALTGNRIKRRLRHSPTWLLPALAFMALVLVATFVGLSVFAGRVEAIDRAFAMPIGEDLRIRSQPAIVEAILANLPFGTGLGSFDTIFRQNEPVSLLGLQYLNQAHNDYLGIALDAGLPGLFLLAAALIWWGYATAKVIRAKDSENVMRARLGSGILLLIFIASATDYPARTPVIMAVVVTAAIWLARGSSVCRRSTLPQAAPHV